MRGEATDMTVAHHHADLASLIASRVPPAPSEAVPTAEQLSTIAASIALRFRPEKIVLFGSRGSGTAAADSDVDLMVILETPLRSPEQAAQIRQSVTLMPPFGLDIVVRTPTQISAGLTEGNHFIEEAVMRGALLYEAADAGVGR